MRHGVVARPLLLGEVAGARARQRAVVPAAARRGRILLTVPCGRPRDDAWFLWQSTEQWRELFRAADVYVYDEEVYERTPDGWAPGAGGSEGVLCAELHPGRVRHEVVRLARTLGRR